MPIENIVLLPFCIITVFMRVDMSPFIESIRAVIRTQQFSLKTEKSYLYWVLYSLSSNETPYAKSLRQIVTQSGLMKHVTARRFCHSFATRLLQLGADIRKVQGLLGHADLRTTEIYIHSVGRRRPGTVSPINLPEQRLIF
jgi:site-specific recombinase XerD